MSLPEPMNLREIRRWKFRAEMFQKHHQWPEDRAEKWADQLLLRDRDGDDRRLCVECKHLLSQWRCARGGTVIAEQLQRCPLFKWETPKQ